MENLFLILIVFAILVLLVIGLMVKGQRFTMVRQSTGESKHVKRGFSFTYAIFGPWVPLFRGHIGGFFLSIFITICSLGIGHFVLCFAYNNMYINYLVKNGYAIDKSTIEDTVGVGAGVKSTMTDYSDRDYSRASESPRTMPPITAVAPLPEPTPKPTPKPANAETVLVSNPLPLWAPGVPVQIVTTQFVHVGEDKENVWLHVKFQNLDKRNVVAVYMDIACFNLLQQQRQVLEGICLIDLNVGCGEEYITPSPIALSFGDIRRCEITVKNVVYSNEDIWTNEQGVKMVPVPDPATTHVPVSLRSQQERDALGMNLRKSSSYYAQPEEREGCWICACGQLNLNESCTNCRATMEALKLLCDPALLEEHDNAFQAYNRQKRKEEEQENERKWLAKRAEEERIRQEQEQRKQELINKAKTMLTEAKEGTVKLANQTKSAIAPTIKKLRQEKIACPHCGFENPWDSGFCEGCGKKLEVAVASVNETEEEEDNTVLCSNCGHINELGDAFCTVCGSPIVPEEASAEPTVNAVDDTQADNAVSNEKNEEEQPV